MSFEKTFLSETELEQVPAVLMPDGAQLKVDKTYLTGIFVVESVDRREAVIVPTEFLEKVLSRLKEDLSIFFYDVKGSSTLCVKL